MIKMFILVLILQTETTDDIGYSVYGSKATCLKAADVMQIMHAQNSRRNEISIFTKCVSANYYSYEHLFNSNGELR